MQQIITPPASLASLSPFNPLARVLRSGVRPLLHMPRFTAASSPVVVTSGDSRITSAAANQIAPTECLFSLIKRRLNEDNPGKSISFYDRAIGGTTYSNFLQTGTTLSAAGLSLPSFFTTVSAVWISYVQSLNPDLIILSWGINDSYSFVASQISSILSTIVGWTKIPDILLCTNVNASPNAGTPFNTSVNQIGYQTAAALTRSVALTKGNGFSISNLPNIGLIDIGRFFTMVHDGYDPCNQYLTQVLTNITGITSFPYTLPQTAGDFDLEITFPGQASSIWSGGVTRVAIDMGPNAASTVNELRILNSSGNAEAIYYPGNSTAGLSSNLGAMGSGDLVFRVTAKNEYVAVSCDGGTPVEFYVPRMAGQMSPQIRLAGTIPAGTNMNVNFYASGTALPSLITCSDAQMYSGIAAQGGNSSVHPDSFGVSSVEYAVLEATDFACQPSPGQYSAPATGATLTCNSGERALTYVIDPSAAIAALTINMPADPANFDTVTFAPTHNVTAVTFANGTLANAPSSFTAGTRVTLTYSLSNGKWC